MENPASVRTYPIGGNPQSTGERCSDAGIGLEQLQAVADVPSLNLDITARIETSPNRVVVQRCQHNWRLGLSKHLDSTADAIIDLQRTADRSEACLIRNQGTVSVAILTEQLHDQAGRGIAFQSQTAKRVKVRDIDRVLHDMHDVRVVPDALCGQCLAADQHAVDRVVRKTVVKDQRPLVISKALQPIDQPGGSSRVAIQIGIQGVDVDVDGRGIVVTNHVVDNYRLRTADVNRPSLVEPAAETRRIRRSPLAAKPRGIAFEDRVGDARLGLMNSQDIERVEGSLDTSHTAAKSEHRMIDITAGVLGEHNAAPVAGRRFIIRAGRARSVVRGIERTARAIAIIEQTGELDLQALMPFGDELRTDAGLDTSPIQFHHDRRIDRQAGIKTRPQRDARVIENGTFCRAVI